MIIFDLCCDRQHRFEGWFHSADDFDAQVGRGLVSCPQCGSTAIRRLPSAVHLAKGSRPDVGRQATPATAADRVSHPLAAIRQVVDLIARHSEDVGSRFADEARRIHYAEAPARPIRGVATDADFEELRDEGIDVVRLPRIDPEDLN